MAAAKTRKFRIDYKALLTATGKLAVDVALGQWAEALKDLVEAFAPIEADAQPDELAAVLIKRALARAFAEMLREEVHAGRLTRDGFTALSGALADMVGDEHTFVPADARRPDRMAMLAETGTALEAGLIKAGIAPERAASVARRLPSYFAVAFDEEWRADRAFDAIPGLRTTGASEQAEREQGWRRYHTWLRRQVAEPVFGESFSLEQVYVFPRAWVSDKPAGAAERRRDGGEARDAKPARRVVEPWKEVEHWVASDNGDDAVRVLGGPPGSGKSSFARMLAARLAGDHNVLLIPLHRIDPTRELIDEVGAFVEYDGFLPHNPLSPKSDETLLLIFDGLDELEMRGRIAHEVVRDFIRAVRDLLRDHNRHRARLKVLMGGREVVLQAVASEFKKPGQVMHLLPYVVPEHEFSQFGAGTELLKADQRDEWWRSYGKLSGRGYDGMPEHLRKGELGEVTGQPLLNYLVARALDRGKLTTADANVNDVYRELVAEVYERNYARDRAADVPPHPAVENIQTIEDFFELLEEVSLAVWHGHGRTVTRREIEAYARRGKVDGLLNALADGAEEGVSKLLLSFYFREHGTHRGEEKTFEFTHKTFGEYLVARRIVRTIGMVADKLGASDRRDRWDYPRAQVHWAETCGPGRWDNDLYRFLNREVAGKPPVTVAAWHSSLLALLNGLADGEWPMERVRHAVHDAVPRFGDQVVWAVNAEQALYAAIQACAINAGTRSVISEHTLERTLRRMQGMGGLYAERTELEHAVMFGLDMVGTTFAGSNIDSCGVLGSCMVNSDFESAVMTNCRFSECDFTDSVFDYLIAEGLIITRCNLSATYFFNAKLSKANFEASLLSGCEFRSANLKDASFIRCDGFEVDFSDANLSAATLVRASLVSSLFVDCVAADARFDHADLTDSDFDGANLKGASFVHARLRGVDFRAAYLKNANFSH
ncbi:MAG TPA: pentapeptide repeat-containing protein, partial [Candidatus Omnitrophota bacterium]|nr:pentapeptide repeat-containing protein [Candidatus Omnitrophota bacterium]